MARLLSCIAATAFLCSCVTPPCGDSVTRGYAINMAYQYTNLEWKATEANALHGADPDNQWVDTPDAAASDKLGSAMWWKPGINRGMPYKWGGFDTPEEFLQRMEQETPVYAGDYASDAKVEGGDDAVSRYAAGIDCSGLVSRCWRLSRPFSTRELGSLCVQLRDFSELKPGDIALKPGVHVILFEAWANKDHSVFYAIEAGGVPHWKCYRYLISIDTLNRLGYTPHRYKNIR